MSKQYIVTLSDAEDKALHTITPSAQEWIDNAVHERCRLAIEGIVNSEVQRKLAAGETISGSKEDIVMGAPVKSAVEINAERLAQVEAEAKLKVNTAS